MSGFRVRGMHQGALYDVLVQPGRTGATVVGSKGLRALLAEQDGAEVALPDGQPTVVDGDDGRSLLALLTAQTRVLHVGAGAPDLASARQ